MASARHCLVIGMDGVDRRLFDVEKEYSVLAKTLNYHHSYDIDVGHNSRPNAASGWRTFLTGRSDPGKLYVSDEMHCDLLYYLGLTARRATLFTTHAGLLGTRRFPVAFSVGSDDAEVIALARSELEWRHESAADFVFVHLSDTRAVMKRHALAQSAVQRSTDVLHVYIRSLLETIERRVQHRTEEQWGIMFVTSHGLMLPPRSLWRMLRRVWVPRIAGRRVFLSRRFFGSDNQLRLQWLAALASSLRDAMPIILRFLQAF